MTSTPTLIVFDCDGTLVDSQHLIGEAMRRAFIAVDLVPPERAAILKTVGLSVPEAVTSLAPDLCLQTRTELASLYREYCFTLRQLPQMQEPMFKGAASLLFDLAGRDDIVLGIATGKSRRGVARFIENNGLQGLFATILTADDAPSKPHPAMLLQAMGETGIGPQATVMIGDTAFDMTMAVRAGVSGVGVTWGYHTPAELKRGGAHIIVATFSALAQMLKTMQTPFAAFEAVA